MDTDPCHAVGSSVHCDKPYHAVFQEEAERQKHEAEEEKGGRRKDRALCRHGITQDQLMMQKNECLLEEYFNLVNTWNVWLRDQNGKHRQDSPWYQFAEKHPDICVDEDCVKFIVGYCVATLLEDPKDDESDARIGMALAMYLIRVTIPKSKRHDVGERSIDKCIRNHTRCLTTSGLILTVANYASCSCLDQLAASAKQEKKTRKCEGCFKEVPYETAWICRGCESTHYCSKECHSESW